MRKTTVPNGLEALGSLTWPYPYQTTHNNFGLNSYLTQSFKDFSAPQAEDSTLNTDVCCVQ